MADVITRTTDQAIDRDIPRAITSIELARYEGMSLEFISTMPAEMATSRPALLKARDEQD